MTGRKGQNDRGKGRMAGDNKILEHH